MRMKDCMEGGRADRSARNVRRRLDQARRPGRALAVACLTFAALTGQAAAPPAQPPAAGPPTRVEYHGTLFYEGHFRHPGDVHPYHSRQIYSTDGRGAARLDWTTWEDGDTVFVPESYLLTDGRVFHRDSPAVPWQEYQGPRARQGRLQACAGLPEALERALRSTQPDRGEAWSRSKGRLDRYTRLWPHPRLGDVRDSVAFFYRPAGLAPDSMEMALHMRDSNWRLTARQVAWSATPCADSLFAAPVNLAPAARSEEDDSLGAVPPFTRVAPGLWSADLADIDSRTLVVEFADHLAVIETAVGSANGERIVDAIRRQWRSKPIRYALFSHYHPHYTGGLRALIAAGATVITTPGNEAFVRRVAGYPFHASPDRLARHPHPLRVVTFSDRYELADSSNRMVAFNYGERSQHTDEFVLFWFPHQQLLFETEQGWIGSGATMRAGRRAKNLIAWISENGLGARRILQGWPMRDTEASLTLAELDSLVKARK